MNTKAPIALFTYNRLWHTQQTIKALQLNEESKQSDLIVFSDEAANENHREKILAVREYLKTVSGFKSVKLIFRNQNFGLAQSVINGVSEVVKEYGKVVVLEDDMITSPYFLRFINDGLDLYAHNEKVACIHGYRYPIGEVASSFFMRGADCWGWGTWKRAWNHFNADGQHLYDELRKRKLQSLFNHQNSFPYMKMLKDQIAGKNNSWAIRWKASAFLNGQYTLYYKESLLNNIGNDDSGTHSKTTDQFNVEVAQTYDGLAAQPVQENPEIAQKIAEFYQSITPTFWQRVMHKLFR